MPYSAFCLFKFFARFRLSTEGNFAISTAVLLPLVLITAGGAVDVAGAFLQKTDLQERLDAGVLAAAQIRDPSQQRTTVLSFIAAATKTSLTPATNGSQSIEGQDTAFQLTLDVGSDGTLNAGLSTKYPTNFLPIAGINVLPITLNASALSKPSQNGCIYVLGNESQAVLINSGANLVAKNCTMYVASTANPAFIMNSGATIDTAKFCVKGTNYIRNGGTLANLKTDCAVSPDPYPSLPEPTLPNNCTTSGTQDGSTQSIKPGMHCETTFNGSPTITFQPGLHIIRGRMIINSNSTVIANNVTFYFPDVNSEIRMNGGIKMTASAPTSGPYSGLLMFEKTSDAGNNANKQQYVFNGSNGETLQGIIHLPNRNVTYNSTTNVSSKITLVVNTMIMNSSKWQVEPYDGVGGGSNGQVRLVR
ncbi:TadE/TadG family type IV pilus assembly protein [Rhizobium oryziradicis]|uniref:Putative Flp pilus-assembly TadG-like N-terminal domain-containing protein n=1 Tax=Rhizobium oryziradicis TaxID=1867956 RepID=A0A1Q8ZV21_9HYPH|nr:TadE/TadG family type IV pilus assembly protein [Rhizobium oryziradicis]OLP45758.1 hypothetical protein BJF95_11595 [Rhizobium oryziradicis]